MIKEVILAPQKKLKVRSSVIMTGLNILMGAYAILGTLPQTKYIVAGELIIGGILTLFNKNIKPKEVK